MSGLEPLIPIFLFLSIAGVVVLRGPIGKAWADRIAGRSHAGPDDRRTAELESAVLEVRDRLAEIEERLDFTERVLARQQEPRGLPKE